MGAAAGKQFQSEKAKHAQAVLSAVELFEESNHQELDSYGGVSTEFFKKKVMMAASDAKRKGKDIEKSLAQLTDADLDMLAHYVENRKAEERRQAAANANSMQVEEIADADNVDETTSVLSYGDAEEEAADNDELESSGEVLENIEESVDARPRLNSGFKVFPLADGDESTAKADGESNGSHQKSKLKLEEATVRPGIADHIAKFWDYEELGSLASLTANGGSRDSPLTGALSPNSTVIGKKFQPSPKQSYPYKDRGQRIDERNEALMVLQRQKVISLTQNAQLEREVEALQRQLEKMDQLDQTFENARLGATNKSTSSSLNNTAGSSSTVGAGTGGFGGVSGGLSSGLSGGYGHSSGLGKYSYIYPIDEELSEQPQRGGEFRKADAKAVQQSQPWRQRRDKAAKGGSSPSSSDNDSVNSYNNSAFPKAAVGAGSARSRVAGGAGVSATAGASADTRGSGKIPRARSNDQSDQSDEFASAPSHSALRPAITGAGTGAGSGKGKRVRIGGAANSANYEGDSDDSAHLGAHSSRHAPATGAGYNPSHPSQRNAHRLGQAGGADHGAESGASGTAAQAKHVESDSENHESNIGRTKPQVLKNKRVISVSSRAPAGGSGVTDDSEAKTNDASLHDQSPSQVTKQGAPQAAAARRAAPNTSSTTSAAADAKHSSPARVEREDQQQQQQQQQHQHQQSTAVAADPKYQVLMDNVSQHLEAVRKDAESAVSAVGSSKFNGRNKHGGALKKLNKRRHSLDGLEDNTAANNSNNVSNTDTSQDEVDASSPSSKYKRFGRHAAGAGAAGAEGVGVHRSPQGTSLIGGESYVTTDDESVGQSTSGPSGVRSKLRRPRAKLALQTSPSGQAGAKLSAGGAVPDAPAAAGPLSVDGEGYQPSVPAAVSAAVAAVESTDSVTAAQAPVASAAAAAPGAAAAAGKVKRRTRSVSTEKSGKESTVSAQRMSAVVDNGFVPGANPWDTQLDQWWAEVSLLLRKPILQEEDMLYTVAAAEAGLIYVEEMNGIAKALNVLRGALSRWILPYDNNTRIDSQCSTPHSVVENMPEEFRGKLTERQVHYLVAGANGVRKLIRVKIADDNDLEQARRALKTTDTFFKALYHRAKEAGITPYQLLQMADGAK